MNKLHYVLLATSLLINRYTITRASGSSYNYQNRIDYVSIEPTKSPRQQSIITIKYSFKTTNLSRATLDLKVSNSQYRRGATLLLRNSLKKEETFSYVYSMEYSNLSEEDTFIINLNSNASSDSVSIKAKIYSPQTIYIRNLNETVESPQNITIYRYGYGTSYYSEKFIFTNMMKDFELDKYRGIDISNVYFEYVAPDDFALNYDNPRLIIEGIEGAFENVGSAMANPNNRKCQVNLERVEETNRYHLSLVNKLYVHPITLDMSMEPLPGYIETDYLFFPAPKEGIANFLVRFMLDDVGANDYDFSYEMSVNVSSNPLGNCSDSSFCLSSEDSDPDLELGTIINH